MLSPSLVHSSLYELATTVTNKAEENASYILFDYTCASTDRHHSNVTCHFSATKKFHVNATSPQRRLRKFLDEAR